MSATRSHQLSRLYELAQRAGSLAMKFRQQHTLHMQCEDHLNRWKSVFSASDVLIFGVGALLLICMDIWFMMPIYRQLSQLVSGDAELLALPIGLGVNVLAIITSEKLMKCAFSNTFRQWEVERLSRTKGADAAIFTLPSSRGHRIFEFAINFSLYTAVLIGMILIRSMLIDGSGTPTERVEVQMAWVGVCIALFAMTIGMYLMLLVQYLAHRFQVALLHTRLNAIVFKVSGYDQLISLLWHLLGKFADVPQDVKESLIRVTLRTHDWNYCAPITELEFQKFSDMHNNQAPPSLLEGEDQN